MVASDLTAAIKKVWGSQREINCLWLFVKPGSTKSWHGLSVLGSKTSFVEMSVSEERTEAAAEVHAIGISFGNSNSSIAYIGSDGKAEVIANEEGDRQIPSILSYIDGEEFHGTQAKTQLVRNSKNTVAYFRDFLGASFDSIDPTNCHASAHPKKHDQTVAFAIKDTESETTNDVTVSEITTRHMRRLATSASDYLGKKINAAVVTVPTNVTEDQKMALSKAAKDAGMSGLVKKRRTPLTIVNHL